MKRIALVLSALALAAPLDAQRDDEALFSLIRDEGRSHTLNDAKRHLKAGRTTAALEAILEVLRCSPSAVVQDAKDHWIGLRESARAVLAGLNADQRKAWETLVGGEAAPRFAAALASGKAADLTRLALQYPSTASAQEARRVAGDRFLEEGRVLRALQEYSLLPDGEANLARRALCRSLLGLSVPSLDGASTLPLGPETLPARDWIKRVRAIGQFGYPQFLVPSYGGGLHGNRPAERPVDCETNAWHRQLQHVDEERSSLNLHPVANGRRTFVNTGTRLYGLDLLSGHGWQSHDPIGSIPDSYARREFLVSLSPHFIHSSAIAGNLVIAPLQVPIIPDIAKENQNFNHIQIMRRLPVRRLHAFEAETGRLVWAHYRPGQVSKESRQPLDVSGPPLVVDDTVYVTTISHLGTIALYVSAFDVHTGKQRWKTLVCSSQTEVNMFGNEFQEFAAGGIAYADGAIYGTTNLGLSFSLRVDDGAIRWLQAYPIIPLPRARMRPDLRRLYWGNSAPVLTDDSLIVTPIDSHYALAHSRDSGRIQWRVHHRVSDSEYRRGYELRWLLGVRKGQAWFAGQCVLTKDLRSGRTRVLASPQKLNMTSDGDSPRRIPRPLLTEDRLYYLSSSGGLVVLDIGGRLRSGVRQIPEEHEIGNLVCSNGILVSARPRHVTAWFELGKLLTRARNAVTKDPTNPAPQLAYAELLAARSGASTHDLEATIKQYRRVLDLCSKSGEGNASQLVLRAKSGLWAKLREIGMVYELTRARLSRNARVEALGLGRELFASGSLLEADLLRFAIGLLQKYERDQALRAQILDFLESEHGKSKFAFHGRESEVGLFVVLSRLGALDDSRSGRHRRLELLRKVLIEYPDALMPTNEVVRGRAFALDGIQDLIAKHGRALYEPFEKQARALFDEAKGDPARLRRILDEFPNSESAARALIEIASLAAKKRDLGRALEAWRFGIDRLPKLPRQLLIAVSSAADAVGNRPLALHLRARLAGRAPLASEASRVLVPRATKAPTGQLQHAPDFSTRRFQEQLSPPILSGFARMASLPLLLRRDQLLYAYVSKSSAPSTGSPEPRYSTKKSDWTTRWDKPLGELEPAIAGKILVLPEESSLRGVDLTNGKTAWIQAEDAIPVEHEIVKSGALSSGLYAVCHAHRDFSRRAAVWMAAFEPISGAKVFERRLAGERVPHLSNGQLFRNERVRGGGRRIIVFDSLDGRDAVTVALDGKTGPQVHSHAARNVLITTSEIFVLAPFENVIREGTAGLYCFTRKGKTAERRWFVPHREVLDADSLIACGERVLLTTAFYQGSPGRILMIDRKNGRTQRQIECGERAQLLGHRYGMPAREMQPQPFFVVGLDSGNRGRVTMIDAISPAKSWSESIREIAAPLPDDFPTPVVADGVVVLPLFFLRRGERYAHFGIFDLATGEPRSAPELRGKPWQEIAELKVWNGDLLARSRDNAWIFGAKMGNRREGSSRRR